MFTGNFKYFFLFSLIIIIHELGHVLAALYYKWEIDRVILLPFGALTIFNEKINRPLFEEFIILIMGPIFQIVFTFLFFRNNVIAFDYSLSILFFNLLPIYPLDGSKLLNICLNKVISFKKSHLITLYVSIFIILFILFKVKFNLILILIFVFIGVKTILEIVDHKNIFNKFLLERYIYNFDLKKEKTVRNCNNMKRDYRHLFYVNGEYKTEKDFLKKMFDFKGKM